MNRFTAAAKLAGRAGKFAAKLNKLRQARKPKAGKTKTKRSFTPGVVQSSGNGISKSSCRKKNKPSKAQLLTRKLAPVDIYRSNDTGTVLADYGVQGTGGDSPNLAAEMIQELFVKSIDTTGTAQGAAVQTPEALDKQFFIESYKSILTLTNQSPNTAKVVVYNLIARQDKQAASPIVPKTIWQLGLTKQAGRDINNELTTYPGSDPRQSLLFRDNYTILKKTEVEMHTGANHEHTFYFDVNKKIPMQKLDEYQGVGYGQFRGVTNFIMITVNGMLCDSAASFAFGNVTTDRAKVIWRNQIEVKTRTGSTKSKHIEYTNVGLLPQTMPDGAFNQNPDGQGVCNTNTNISNAIFAFS